MKMMVLWGLLAVLVLFGAWVRLAPVDAARWHIDPIAAGSPGAAGWLVRNQGGDSVAPVYAATPAQVLTAFDAIALSTPRTRVVAGSVGDGRITYETRSRLWGFPDYTTVAAQPVSDGAGLAVLGRARFGQSDVGVNRARIEAWQIALGERLSRP